MFWIALAARSIGAVDWLRKATVDDGWGALEGSKDDSIECAADKNYHTERFMHSSNDDVNCWHKYSVARMVTHPRQTNTLLDTSFIDSAESDFDA